MLHRINVWEKLTGEDQPVGEMICEIATDGRSSGAFRYARAFLEKRDAFPLDPSSLPLRPEPFPVQQPGIHAIFEDSLPDDWGRKLLIRKHNIPLREQIPPHLLLALGCSGLGALSYTGQGKPGPPSADAPIVSLANLLVAAEMFERGEPVGPEFSLLFGAGSSPGGARPKALVFDEQQQVHYLAKFPSIRDDVDVVRIEAATMSLAAKAGLTVPTVRLRLVQNGRRMALLVKRFDVIPAGRRHMISLQTLLKAQGYYVFRYADVLGALRRYSADPLEDSTRLFRQMVFNAVIGNTDDHLKNFWMLYAPGEGWRLSPAFDLVPDIGKRGEHVLIFDDGSLYPGRRKLGRLGSSWGISGAEHVVEEVFSAVSAWRTVYRDYGVEEQDISRFREIDRNLVC